jgi:uncharacterized protein
LIILGASGLYTAIDDSQPRHVAARRTLESEQPPHILSPFTLAELDYLVTRDAGVAAELGLLAEVGRGTYELATFEREDVEAAHDVIARHRDLKIGLADASLVVLAERYETNRILTLDERHFRVLRPRHAKSFVVLPADA